jgi:putative ATP-dependent endonuclease of OLD family
LHFRLYPSDFIQLALEAAVMYISEVYAAGFRCFSIDKPLSLKLRRGLNILAGPNDSGKTAVIDAPRYLLWTRGDDYVRLEPSDFHVKSGGSRESELIIRCTFDDLSADEESRFLEWCNNEGGKLRLYVCLRGTLRKASGGGSYVVSQYRAGTDADGLPLDGDLREYLKATYLRPLRDAERELSPGRRSRLSRILGALPEMAKQSKPAATGGTATLIDIMKTAELAVEGNEGVTNVQKHINKVYLDVLSFADDALSATLDLGSRQSFEQLLERLELYLNPQAGHTERLARGLGYNNLLFMAAELLLLQSHPEQVPFLLIEEPEAHLHPQHQTLFTHLLENKTAAPVEGDESRQVQVLLTTHSPQLAANASLEAMILMVGHSAFSLALGKTKLAADDYAFLRRFLDATKANLFFARGVLIVEGDGENLLLPALARKLGKPLSKHGVSIVNVGHRGLFRYSRILQRADGSRTPIAVALLPDRDIPPDVAKIMVGKSRATEGEYSPAEIASHIDKLTVNAGGSVKAFVSEQWTLEFDIARRPACARWMHQAVQLAKGRADMTHEQISAAAIAEVTAWQADATKTADEIAVSIYAPLYKRQVSKAETAEQLAKILDELPVDPDFAAKLPPYIVAAIDHVTQGNAPPAPDATSAPGASSPL